MRVKRASVVTATLIPRGLEVSPGDLSSWNAADLMNRLRSQLKRAESKVVRERKGEQLPRGWLLGGCHCEFDPTGEIWQFHYHLIASGHHVRVLESLRSNRLYKRALGDRVRDRIRISRKPLDKLPAPLGYPWQLFWPARARRTGCDETGFNQLHRTKRRVPEPYHTQMLLWFDQQRIEDMTLMMGLRVGVDGFVKTYTDDGA